MRFVSGVLGACSIGVFVGSLACASAPPPRPVAADEDRYVEGVRVRPLAVEEVEQAIRRARDRIVGCYRTERMNTAGKLSDFVFRLQVPTTGEAPKATRLQASVPAQRALESCLTDALQALRFPAHKGEALSVEVPIEGPAQ